MLASLPDGVPGEYLTDRLTEEALRFIEKNKDGLDVFTVKGKKFSRSFVPEYGKILAEKEPLCLLNKKAGVMPVFLFDPSEGYPEYNEDIYLLLIDYYEEYEEYEKCQELLHTMEIHKSI